MKRSLKASLFMMTTMVALTFLASCSNIAKYEVQLPTQALEVSLTELQEKYTKANPLTIKFWTGFGSAVTTDGILPGIEAFEEAYPYIKVEHTSKGGYPNLLKAINLSITSRSYPNVAVGYPDHFANYIRSSIQYALDDFIFSEDPEIGVDYDDFVADYMVENRSFQYKDEAKTQPYTLGLPFNKSTEVMVVNKTFMDWVKTKDATIEIPTTWDEVRTMGGKILDVMGRSNYYGNKIDEDGNKNPNAGKTGHRKLLLDLTNVTQEEFRPFSYDSTENMFITMIRQWGAEYTRMGENITKGFIKFDNQKTIDMLTFFKQLHADNIFAIPPDFDEAGYNSIPFKALKSVMTISSSGGVYNNVPTGGAFEIEVHPVIAKDADHRYVISQGTNLAIFTNRDAEKVLASWLFVRFMTTTYNADFGRDTGYYPVTYTGLDSDDYQSYLALERQGATAMSKIGAAKVNAEIYGVSENNWYKFVDPGFVGSSDIREQIGTVFPMVLYGKDGTPMTPKQVIDYNYSQLSRYIEKESSN